MTPSSCARPAAKIPAGAANAPGSSSIVDYRSSCAVSMNCTGGSTNQHLLTLACNISTMSKVNSDAKVSGMSLLMIGKLLGHAQVQTKPLSAAALGVGVTCLGIATALRFAVGWSESDLRYAIFLPAILATGLLAGAPAAIGVMIASLVTVAWAFMLPYFAFKSLSSPELATVFWSLFSSLCVILFAQGCRTVLKRLRAHQLTNDILVRELAHRGRNIFAVIEVVLQKTLSSDREQADALQMAFDTDRIDEAVLALLYLGLHDDSRAWKGFDWDAMRSRATTPSKSTRALNIREGCSTG